MSRTADLIREAAKADPPGAYVRAGYTGRLRRSGKRWVGTCEFHSDKRPSFTLFPDGKWMCFGCGAHGSIIDYWMRRHNEADVRQAIQDLAVAQGLPHEAHPKVRPSSPDITRYRIIDEHGEVLAEHCRRNDARRKKMWWERNGNLGQGGLRAKALPLYRLPDLLASSTDELVFVCEGERAADALAEHGFVALGTVCGASAIPERQVFEPLADRRVVLWPDNDDEGRRHMEGVAAQLTAVGAKPCLLTWENAPDKGDAADFFAAGGTADQVRQLAETASDRAHLFPAGASGKGGSPSVCAANVAAAILASDRFALGPNRSLYAYVASCFRECGVDHVKLRVQRLLTAASLKERWSRKLQNETIEFLRVGAPPLWECPPLDQINVTNGLLDVNTYRLQPHSPDFLSPVQLPVRYDPDADCPAWHEFISQVFPSDAQELPWMIAAWLMVPDTSLQKALLLVGDGANGKSTFLDALRGFLGEHNCTSLSLTALEQERFAPARLVGKLANLCHDLPAASVRSSSIFRAVVAGDPIAAEQKGRTGFDFRPFARLVFATNHLPLVKDASPAFYRRWLAIPFPQNFEGARAVPRHVLVKSLTTPRELSGLLNMALALLPQVRDHGLPQPGSVTEALQELRDLTDPVRTWFRDQIVVSPQVFAAKQDLQNAYNRWAAERGLPPVSAKSLTKALESLAPEATEAQRTVGGCRTRVWMGIGLSTRR